MMAAALCGFKKEVCITCPSRTVGTANSPSDSTGNHHRINAIAQRYGESVLHRDDRGNILAHATDTRDSMNYIVRIHSVSGEMTRVCPAPNSSPDEFTLVASRRTVFRAWHRNGTCVRFRQWRGYDAI